MTFIILPTKLTITQLGVSFVNCALITGNNNDSTDGLIWTTDGKKYGLFQLHMNID